MISSCHFLFQKLYCIAFPFYNANLITLVYVCLLKKSKWSRKLNDGYQFWKTIHFTGRCSWSALSTSFRITSGVRRMTRLLRKCKLSSHETKVRRIQKSFPYSKHARENMNEVIKLLMKVCHNSVLPSDIYMYSR